MSVDPPKPAAPSPSSGDKPASSGAAKKPVIDDDLALTPEDKKLKESIEEHVAVILATPADGKAVTADAAAMTAQKAAIEALRREVKDATSTMTAIPKPLKFLRSHYAALKAAYNDPLRLGPQNSNTPFLADVLSMVAMTQTTENREVLAFRLLGTDGNVGEWGHEYLRALAGEIGVEYQKLIEEDVSPHELVSLVDAIVKYNFENAAEIDAIDLLIEVSLLDKASPYINPGNASRVGKYLLACSSYSPDVDDRSSLISAAFDCFVAHGHPTMALISALKLPASEARTQQILACFTAADGDAGVIRQLGYILGSQRVYVPEVEENGYDVALEPMGNAELSRMYLELAKDLDVMEPKAPADVYKEYLEEGRSVQVRRAGHGQVDSALQNLASTLVNGFVNVGFGKDTLILGADGTASNSDWLYRNKGNGMLTAAASTGLLTLWNVEEGFSTTDKFSFSKEEAVVAGSHLASGLLSTGVTSDMNASLALLSEQLESGNDDTRVAAALGLGVAYAGSANDEVLELLVPFVLDSSSSMALMSTAVLAIGLVFVGTGNGDVFGTAMEALLERENTDLDSPAARVACVGMALVYLSTQQAETAADIVGALQHPLKMYLLSAVDTFAHAGTGNVLALQRLLSQCAEKPAGSVDGDDDDDEEPEAEGKKGEAKTSTPAAAASAPATAATAGDAPAAAAAAATAAGESATATVEDDDETAAPSAAPAAASTTAAAAAAPLASPSTAAPASSAKTSDKPVVKGVLKHIHRGSAVLGLAAVALGEDITAQMALRSLDHVLQCGDVYVRRAVPLALGLVSVSNPQLTVMDSLSKLSHDQDEFTSMNAALALGFLGAGTNNSRIAAMQRSLALFYTRDPQHLFAVRLGQGLLHLGKGLCTLNPRSHEGQLLNKPALGALLAIMHLSLDLPDTLIKARHYLFLALAAAVRPRFLFTVDEEGQQVPVPVRVGQAVDNVGQPGNPRGITGFQTHTTPVLLAAGERAELANDDFIAVADILEGVVVVKPNPDAPGKA